MIKRYSPRSSEFQRHSSYSVSWPESQSSYDAGPFIDSVTGTID
jgi:hypothetical protein